MPGLVELDPGTVVTSDDALDGLASQVRTSLGFEKDEKRPGSASRLHLCTDASIAAEGYRLTLAPGQVEIAGGDPAGVYYGYQTLRQLLPPAVYRASTSTRSWTLQAEVITDSPRFPWRGLMLDVARHFVPVREVVRLIDLMAIHKLNVLHLHLTDDQGWRPEILRYPELTRIGSWRAESQLGLGEPVVRDGRPHGGYYSQDDLREIVAFAATRHVTVVPEIDAPGHAQAAIAAYPHLGPADGTPVPVRTDWGISDTVFNVEDETIQFLKNVLDELLDIFPSTFIGIGGDECPKTQWKNDPATQATMLRRGIGDEERLQSWFVGELAAHLARRGRRALGWDEILEGGIAPDASVLSWRGMTGATIAAKAGHDVISCPYDQTYLDHRQSISPHEPIASGIVLDVDAVHAFEPVPPGLSAEERKHVLGGQANIWTEHIDSTRMLDYYAFPRASALAEALWSIDKPSRDDFAERLEHHLRRLEASGVEYRPATGPLPWQRRPGVTGRPMTDAECEQILADLVRNIAN